MVGGKIYWTDWITRKIQCSNLDGTNVEDVITGLGEPRGIAVDAVGGRYTGQTMTQEKFIAPTLIAQISKMSSLDSFTHEPSP